ncbi:MAG: peptidyl-alpha-hydroxyglycine alpha-amidating lyase family protein [Rhodospirillaceae bacterium]
MRILSLAAAFVAMSIAGQALAQGAAPAAAPPREMSPEDKALNASLVEMIKTVPLLPMERTEIKVPMKLGMVSAMAVDKAGNIYILHRPKDGDPIVVVDKGGKILRSFGKGMYTIPHSIHIDPQGNVWTTDANTSKVRKFSADGKSLLEITVGEIPDEKRPFCSVTGVAFPASGNVLISDGYCNARILEYTQDGKRVKTWGAKGKGNGEFTLPHDVTIGTEGRIFVADRENGRVQWFDKDEKYLGQKLIGGRLYSVAAAPDGGVYVGVAAKGGATLDENANIFKINTKTGAVEGRIEMMSHETEIGADGSLYPGHSDLVKNDNPNESTIVVYRPKK